MRYTIASKSRRFFAFITDATVASLVMAILSFILGKQWPIQTNEDILKISLYSMAGSILFYVLLPIALDTSFGKLIFDIQKFPESPEGTSITRNFFREAFICILSPLAALSLLMNPRRRHWGDLIGNTIVAQPVEPRSFVACFLVYALTMSVVYFFYSKIDGKFFEFSPVVKAARGHIAQKFPGEKYAKVVDIKFSGDRAVVTMHQGLTAFNTLTLKNIGSRWVVLDANKRDLASIPEEIAAERKHSSELKEKNQGLNKQALIVKAHDLIEYYLGSTENLDEAYQIGLLLLNEHKDPLNANVIFSRVVLRKGYINGRRNFDPRAVAKAETFALEALKLNDKEFMPHYMLASIYDIRSEKVSFEEELKVLRQIDPNHRLLKKLEVGILKDEKRWAEIIPILQNQISQTSNSNELVGYNEDIANAYWSLKDIDKADLYYKKAVALSKSTWPKINYSSFLVSNERYDDAITILNPIVNPEDRNAMSTHILSEAYAWKANDLSRDHNLAEQAGKFAQLALSLNPTNSRAHYIMVIYYGAMLDKQPKNDAYKKAGIEHIDAFRKLEPQRGNDGTLLMLEAKIRYGAVILDEPPN